MVLINKRENVKKKSLWTIKNIMKIKDKKSVPKAIGERILEDEGSEPDESKDSLEDEI